MRTRIGAATALLFLIAAPAWALSGIVIDARTRSAIAHAEVTVVGQRGSVRTASDGRFEWALPATSPLVFVVILPDGRVGRPIRVNPSDASSSLTLPVEASVSEAVHVSGAAPSIDISAGSSTSLVVAADISLRHPATLGQALENVPGVSVISEGQSATPAIRGLARGRTSILVDGSRASSERRAGPNASFLDPGSIERVEVARGPGSVAYGSDAMGGIIAVRTRRPDRSRGLRGRFAGALGAGGQPETSGDLEVSAGYGVGGILVGVRARDLSGYDSPQGPVANSGWRDRGLRLRWEHESGPAVWSAGWQTDQGRDIGRPRSDSDMVRVETPFEDSHRFTASYERQSLAGFRRLRVDGLLGSTRQQTDQDRLATPARTRSLEQAEVGSRELQLRATADRPIGTVRLQLGGDVDARYGLESIDTVVSYTRQETVAATQITPSIENAHRTSTGLFAQAEMPVARRVRLSGGLRGDVVHSVNAGGFFGDRAITHSALAGSGAVTILPGGPLAVTAQLSRGFREPMLSDRFYRGPVGRGFIEGNPSLGPETSLQLDVGARYDTGGLAISGALYDYRISNLIERYQSGPNSFLYRNRGAARLRGAELEVRAALPRGFSLATTVQASRGRDADDGTPVDDIAPASLSVVARHGGGPLSAYLRATAFTSHDSPGPTEVRTPAYGLVDAGAAWRIGRRLQLAAVLRNLLDEAYPSSAGPRWVYASGRSATVSTSVVF